MNTKPYDVVVSCPVDLDYWMADVDIPVYGENKELGAVYITISDMPDRIRLSIIGAAAASITQQTELVLDLDVVISGLIDGLRRLYAINGKSHEQS